jgi:hypothetical protein
MTSISRLLDTYYLVTAPKERGRVGIFKEKLRVDITFQKKYDGISTLIKM